MSLALFRGSLHINAGGRQIPWSLWVSKFDSSDFVSLSVQILWFSNSTAISSWRSFWNGFVSPHSIFFHSSPFVISVRAVPRKAAQVTFGVFEAVIDCRSSKSCFRVHKVLFIWTSLNIKIMNWDEGTFKNFCLTLKRCRIFFKVQVQLII